ncbi:hypothetical protein HDR58_09975 [bacterium]|nr:hypothetical protein [bacterium]
MKKFIVLLSLLCICPSVLAEDAVTLWDDLNFQKLTINDIEHAENDVNISQELFPTIAPLATPEFLKPVDTLETQSKLHTGISNAAKYLYNLQIDQTNTPSSLFEEQLTKHFENGPVDSLHVWGVVQSTFSTDIPEDGGGRSKFNTGLTNVLFDAKMKGGQDMFRLMFDVSHQHNRGFMHQFVQDAYYATKRIPHHTILIGNSRPGVGYEGAQSPYTLPFINRSQISRNLANVRKVGVRVKGDYSFVDYDFGGYSSDTFFTEFLPGVEFDGWVNLKPLAKTNGKYGRLTTGSGVVSGTRNSIGYLVGGAYVGYTYKNFWTRMEYAISDGSNGVSGLTDKRRQGWYVTLGYFLTKKLEVLARYDEFDPDRTTKADNQREYTAGVNYYIKGQALKFIMNYIYCQNEAKADSHRILLGAQLAI